MTAYEFRLPDIGEGVAEAEIVAWHIAAGDKVEEDQPLCDVMTDKATVELSSPVSGVIVERRGEIGRAVAVGSVLLVFETAEGGSVPPEAPSAVPSVSPAEPGRAARARVLASPAVRRRAAEAGIDLAAVVPSGPGGRVRQMDLDAFLAYRNQSPALEVGEREGRAAAHADRSEDGVDVVPLIGLRRRIAERMQDTKRRIPHFSYVEEIDMSAIEALRAELNADTKKPRLTILPFLIRALAEVIPAFPQMNARFDDEAGIVRRYKALHAGIATQTDAGLVVTVVRDAQTRDLRSTAAEIARLSDTVRRNRATPSELSGSTITISSLGPIGGMVTTPVINSPEVAIIGVNRLVERPVVRDGRIEVARMMNLSCSFDHRVIDGWDAARFVQAVKRVLEHPAMLFLRD